MKNSRQYKVSSKYVDGKGRILLLHSNKGYVVFNNEYSYDSMQQVKVMIKDR